jgi:hypothetical protein
MGERATRYDGDILGAVRAWVAGTLDEAAAAQLEMRARTEPAIAELAQDIRALNALDQTVDRLGARAARSGAESGRPPHRTLWVFSSGEHAFVRKAAILPDAIVPRFSASGSGGSDALWTERRDAWTCTLAAGSEGLQAGQARLIVSCSNDAGATPRRLVAVRGGREETVAFGAGDRADVRVGDGETVLRLFAGEDAERPIIELTVRLA